MYCMKCGSPMPDQAKFCPKCGTPVRSAAPASSAPVVAPDEKKGTRTQSVPADRRDKKISLLLAAGIALNVVLMFLWGYGNLYFRKRSFASSDRNKFSISLTYQAYEPLIVVMTVLFLVSALLLLFVLLRRSLKRRILLIPLILQCDSLFLYFIYLISRRFRFYWFNYSYLETRGSRPTVLGILFVVLCGISVVIEIMLWRRMKKSAGAAKEILLPPKVMVPAAMAATVLAAVFWRVSSLFRSTLCDTSYYTAGQTDQWSALNMITEINRSNYYTSGVQDVSWYNIFSSSVNTRGMFYKDPLARLYMSSESLFKWTFALLLIGAAVLALILVLSALRKAPRSRILIIIPAAIQCWGLFWFAVLLENLSRNQAFLYGNLGFGHLNLTAGGMLFVILLILSLMLERNAWKKLKKQE